MRIGLLGGTFDPIHRGHLDLAHAARRALQLDEVWLVPARHPPHRRAPIASAEERLSMVEAAARHEAGLRASDVDMAAEGPSYTSRTLDELAARGLDLREVFFITGADAFREIETWRNFPDLLDRCHFVVVSRGGVLASGMPAVLPTLARRMRTCPCQVPDQPSIFLVDAPTAPVSSTDVRRRAAAGQSIEDLVPGAVARYIRARGLYSDPVVQH